MQDILKTFEGVLGQEQIEAVGNRLAVMVEEHAERKAKKIVEEQVEQIKAIALKAGEKFYNDKLGKMKQHFANVVEEMVDKERTKCAEAIKVVEESLIKGVAQVVEESVQESIPQDVAQTIASARAVISLVEEAKQVFENHMVAIDPDISGKLSEADQKVKIAEESVQAKDNELAILRKEANTAKARLLIETKCRGLAEESRQMVYTMMKGKTLSAIEGSLDRAVVVAEEHFKSKSSAPVVEEQTSSTAQGVNTSVSGEAPNSQNVAVSRAVGIVEEGMTPQQAHAKPQPAQEAVDSFQSYF